MFPDYKMAELNGKNLENGDAENALLSSERCESIALEWRNVTYTVKCGKGERKISNNLSGKAMPGTLTAIMGPSGAGKTTLLNILTGYYERGFEGEVQVNGYCRDVKLFNKQSSYVMQEECLLPELTIAEALMMAAHLRLSSKFKNTHKEIMITEIMQQWGIEHAKNTRTSNLSGGERRRLSIAQELIGNPPVFFLDEPTRGLDSVTSLKCTEVMKSLAQKGHTVICSIHQPSAKIFSYFDQLYMLSEGQCIYNGTIPDLVPFLSSKELPCPEYHNPADFVTEIAAGEYGSCTDKLASSFIQDFSRQTEKVDESEKFSPLGGRILTEEDKDAIRTRYDFATSRPRQFWVLWKRSFTCTFRNWILTPIRVTTFLLTAAILCVICKDVGYWADNVYRNAFLFVFLDLFLIFSTMLPTLIIFPTEIAVILREHRNCWYSLKTYCMAKMMADLPIQTVCMVILISSVYFATGQPYVSWRFGLFLLFSLQSMFTSQALGFAVSAMSTLENSLILCLFVAAPFFLFNGFFTTLTTFPTWLNSILYISYFFYSFVGKMEAVFDYGRENLPCQEFFCYIVNPDEFLDFINMDSIPLYVCSLAIFFSDVAFRIATYFILKFRLKRKSISYLKNVLVFFGFTFEHMD